MVVKQEIGTTIPWAKLYTDPNSGAIRRHPLIAHCADVATVTDAILHVPTIRDRIAHAALLPHLDDTQIARLTVLAFLHDLGKCNRGFQAKDKRTPGAPTAGHVRETLVLLGGDDRLTTEFTTRTRWAEMAPCWADDETLLRLLVASLSHHGDPIVLDGADPRDARWWDTQALDDVTTLCKQARLWWPGAFVSGGVPLPRAPRFQHVFAGLVALADWLGSDVSFFPFDDGDGSARMEFATDRAREAVAVIGLAAGHVPADAPSRFMEAFGFAPRSLQSVVETAPLAQVAVFEGETGSGKTEAALWWWRRLHDAYAVDGLYFALPTRSAATQLHGRVTDAIAWLWGIGAPVCVLAVPGYIRADSHRGRPLPDWEVLWDDQPQAAERHRRWAAEAPRRFLAAGVAVGTIDQALLGALRITHSAMRSSALLRHLLVVDEVHGSDAYMGALLLRLVQHHVACGGYVLALSATLGARLRTALLGQSAPSFAAACAVPYPAVHAGIATVPAATDAHRSITVWTVTLLTSEDTTRVVEQVQRALSDNAAVLVVRNTVRDAVATTKSLEASGISVLLHHGRFAPEDRRALDDLVEAALGKRRKAGAACVVATQTCEQSLDIDADVLITDLCPADVLLQRIGRLHRHARSDRPARWAKPTAIVLTPPGGIEPLLNARRPALGLGVVYRDLRVIQLTLGEITRRGEVVVPTDCRSLVELTTHPDALACVSDRSDAWRQHGESVDGEAFAAGGIAAVACVDRTAPWGCRRIASARDAGDEAATRLGAKDIRIEVDWPGAVVPRVRSVTLPGWLLPGVNPETITAGAADIVAGRWRFAYGRYGLEWTRV